jgi:hypothetical protein
LTATVRHEPRQPSHAAALAESASARPAKSDRLLDRVDDLQGPLIQPRWGGKSKPRASEARSPPLACCGFGEKPCKGGTTIPPRASVLSRAFSARFPSRHNPGLRSCLACPWLECPAPLGLENIPEALLTFLSGTPAKPPCGKAASCVGICRWRSVDRIAKAPAPIFEMDGPGRPAYFPPGP